MPWSGIYAVKVAVATERVCLSIEETKRSPNEIRVITTAEVQWMVEEACLTPHHQLRRLDAEGVGDFRDDGGGGVCHPAFDLGNIGAVDAGSVGQFFLRPDPILPDIPDVSADDLPNIHAAGVAACRKYVYSV